MKKLIIPVSYTHLDVYKRQALKDSDKDIYLPDEPEKRASLDEYNEYCHELLNTCLLYTSYMVKAAAVGKCIGCLIQFYVF